METIFKEGDRVFCYNLGGWGEVIKIFNDDNPFPIYCSFDLGNSNFTKEGRFYTDSPPILSFTEYTLEGFSQERPEPLPKKGDVVWVREYGASDWRVSHFFGKVGDKYLASIFGIENLASTWPQMTTKNPHANEQ